MGKVSEIGEGEVLLGFIWGGGIDGKVSPFLN